MRKLRPYQSLGYSEIFHLWEKDRLVMFVLATGGGKTFTFTEVARAFYEQGKRAMLVAHREELIVQNCKSIQDAGMLAAVLKAGYPQKFEMPVQVASIQTLARRKKLPDVDVLIIDEAHHVQDDNTYGKLIQRYPNAKVLMVTATPYRLSGEGFVDLVEGEQTKLIVNMTLRDLIADGWLVPLKYFVGSIPDMSGVAIVKGEYQEEGARKAMELAPLVDSYRDVCDGKKGICYCINVAHSMEVARQYNAAGIPAEHLDANSPDDVRIGVQSKFRAGEVKVICNVGILTEGADFPDCDFVQLARPTKSLSMYLQMVGRVSRALPGIVDKHADIDSRLQAIAESEKPFGFVLDNSGCWLEHGFPDDARDWDHYFKGWKKEKPKEDENMIEIMIFEVEDPETGQRKKTTKISEVPGMILVEVTTEWRERLRGISDIGEFEKLYKYALMNPSWIQKPGYWAYFRIKEQCSKKHQVITEDLWRYMKRKLVDEVDQAIDAYLDHCQRNGITAIPSMNIHVTQLRARGVSKLFFQKEKEQYQAANAARTTAITPYNPQ